MSPRVRDTKHNPSRREFIGAGTLASLVLTGIGRTEALNNETFNSRNWDCEADVVVVGAGATGLPAAIEARQQGASVIVIDANWDVGGHAILSGGNLALGGGTALQRKHGILDSPEILFSDLTDWSVVESNGFPDYRYNDREVVRAFSDLSAPTFEWLVAQGVTFVPRAPDTIGSSSTGNSAPRSHHTAAMNWPLIQTGAPLDPEDQLTSSSGVGLIRPLEATARKIGAEILLQHKMTTLIREQRASGRVLGIQANHEGATLNIRAKKGVIIATGGSSGNVNFRRMFDPRLTEEYDGPAGEPYSRQDASGELAAIAVGASLWGAYNQTGEFGLNITKAGRIGCQYGYPHLEWQPDSRVFPLVRAIGLRVRDPQDLILVNQLGLRFFDEMQSRENPNASNTYNSVHPYTPGSYRNAANTKYSPSNFLDAALAGTGDGSNGGGPIWAVFDAGAVKRENWTVDAPHVDIASGYFFSGNTIRELARNIINKHQRKQIPPDTLHNTVNKYNSYVDAGTDVEFAKPNPTYKIQTPPFYAAWATPVIHDTRAGLRINAKCEVVDFCGNTIAGLYCGGESAGGFSLHGMARCIVQGRIAGRSAAGS
jgi:succinate dehydrogenase/fumarate reductase flavoprotein subunit